MWSFALVFTCVSGWTKLWVCTGIRVAGIARVGRPDSFGWGAREARCCSYA